MTKYRLVLDLFYSKGEYFHKASKEEVDAQDDLLILASKEAEVALIEAFGFLPIRTKRKDGDKLELIDIRLDRSHILTLKFNDRLLSMNPQALIKFLSE